VQQPALRAQVKEAWSNNWLPMADPTQARPPRVWKVGTPYHVADIMADWRREHDDDRTALWLPVHNYVSPWPEAFTPEYLRRRREKMGPVAYARAYELVPISSDTLIFSPTWLDLYDEIPESEIKRGGEMVATFDFAYAEKRLKDDPDWSVCLIGWLSRSGNVWLTDMLRARKPFPEFKRDALTRCARAGVTRARAEANGPQRGIVQQLNNDAPFPVVGIERSADKITRATEQQAFVEAGRLHIPGRKGPTGETVPTATFAPLWDEMTTFPASEHDDTVDAVVDMMAACLRPVRQTRVARIQSPQVRPARLYQ
jgi:predicted phage terminase large subunit-like protein